MHRPCKRRCMWLHGTGQIAAKLAPSKPKPMIDVAAPSIKNSIENMSLYHEAAEILGKAQKNGGSLKSIVFGKKTWKTDGKTLFALTSEAAKWSEVLSEVVEKSGVLGVEKSVR